MRDSFVSVVQLVAHGTINLTPTTARRCGYPKSGSLLVRTITYFAQQSSAQERRLRRCVREIGGAELKIPRRLLVWHEFALSEYAPLVSSRDTRR